MAKKEQYERIKSQQAANHKKPFTNRLKTALSNPDRITQGLLCLFTSALVVVGILQYVTFIQQRNELASTDRTLRELLLAANRAWIAPLRTSIIAGVDDPKGPSVIVHYQNVGKSPALDVRIGMGPVAVDVEEAISPTREYPQTPLWDLLGKTFRETCNKNEPTGGMGAVYPSPTTESNVPSHMTTPWNKDRLLNGTQMIVVTACFTYRTMEIVGHSGYCNYIFHIAGQPNQSWEIRTCPVANYAE